MQAWRPSARLSTAKAEMLKSYQDDTYGHPRHVVWSHPPSLANRRGGGFMGEQPNTLPGPGETRGMHRAPSRGGLGRGGPAPSTPSNPWGRAP